ncbi:MAG: tRNA (guanosine(37)-N1)-methyltransferase TrmD [Acutalibacteraceae bacterium]|nr:tRNA (guanosine(37)-N1)-methyltransferase TrmD [Acutalibacteraceae bacterium]
MTIDIMTLFPEMCYHFLNESIIGRARVAGKVEIECYDIRDFSDSKHKRVDYYPYGGGMGMVMTPQPIYDCYKAICEKRGKTPKVIYMSPKGKTLTQQKATQLSKTDGFIILCGHYEGVDQRIIDEIVDEEISIGDYVLTGGEIPALVLADCVCRLCEGVLSDDECFTDESHYSGLLEYPQYTRPPEWNGQKVPEILLSGHHENIAKWRHEQKIIETYNKRPDMLKKVQLSEKDKKIISDIDKKEN